MQITTLPVYSKLADARDVPDEVKRRLPEGWALSLHQLATYDALRSDDVDVVINTAMTGDGKSLAGMLPLLTQSQHAGTLALFPTNELIRDQHRSALGMLTRWGRPAAWAGTLYGLHLDALYANAEQLSRPEVLIRELKNHRLVLSNPDILHAILQFHYQQYGRVATHVASQIPLQFDQLTFDEFHIFDTPEVLAVLTGLLFLATQHTALKTLFLSATPTPQVLELLQRSGLTARLRLIEPQREGWYHHGDHPGAGWRPILQQSTLTFSPLTAEAWAETGAETVLLPWFRAHRPAARAALIVNSVAAAMRIAARLAPALTAAGLTLALNTGLTDYAARQASYSADLLIATSTVDVGVDFRINLLIFESGSAGTFLQRLGRLGRHTSFIDHAGDEHHFTAFAAHALLPPFVYERLTLPVSDAAAPFTDGATYTREQLGQSIAAVFPPPTQFHRYAQRWGRFVPAKVIQTLSHKSLRATFGSVRDHLYPRYGALVQANIGAALHEWKTRLDAGEQRLIEEAQSFRGGSVFECGLLKDDANEPLTYDLFWLLANAEIELLSRTAFLAEVARRYGTVAVQPFERGFQRFFFRWRTLRAQRTPVTVQFDRRVAIWGVERQQNAQLLPGFALDCADHDCLPQINARLTDESCVGLIVPGHEPTQIQRALYLPPGLHLWPYRADSLDAGELTGTVAFGRDSLLLDSRLSGKPLAGVPDAPMIF
jgi:CRISPR-associated endonuclease/helicase Cas3